MRRYGIPLLGLALLLVSSSAAVAKPPKEKKVPPGLAKKEGVPPGLAKKGGLPPGLAKRFGPTVPERAYIAFDPRYDDRAWFLIGDRWVLERGFTTSVRREVREVWDLPPAPPPPVPLPRMDIRLRVVVFENP
jgi:hypothetical protein